MSDMDPLRNELSLRPGGLSDSDDDDSDCCFEDPAHTHFYSKEFKITRTVQERLQSIVIQGIFAEFENFFKEELKSNPNHRFDCGWTPLMYTCFHGQPEMAHFLLERGADPNAHADSVTPLALLSSNSFASDEVLCNIAAELLAKGGIINLGDNQGVTPTMRAVQGGRRGLLKFFVENNANIEMRDRQGWTTIFWAVHCNSINMLEYLILRGARVTEVDRANRTLLDIAEANENGTMVKIIEPYFDMCGAEGPMFLSEEPDYWLEYYPGLRTTKNQMYKNEIDNMLYGMNCDDLRTIILNSGIDLRTFLLLEEKDMIKMGIDMKFGRERLIQGIRAFHLRNWKLKSVSGLYARQTENYNLCECLESAACNLMQLYIIEATVQYTIREFNKICYEEQKEARGTHTVSEIHKTIKKLCTTIRSIKSEICRMHESLDYIRKKNPELVEIQEDEKTELQSSVHAILIGALSITLGYFTIQSTKFCFSVLSKNKFFLR